MITQSWLRPFRIIAAILILFGFILLFSDVKGKLPSGLYNFLTWFQFVPSVLKFITVTGLLTTGFILVIILTLFTGRTYCSFLCPLGIMQDMIIKIRSWIPIKMKRNRYTKPLNYIRYPVLALTVVSLIFSGLLAINWLDPYANFGRITSSLYQPFFIAGRNLLSEILMKADVYAVQPVTQKVFHPLPFFAAASILLLILVMVLFRKRLYCNTICPLGAFLGLLSKISFLKIRIEKTTCTQCGNCQKVCKAGCIDIREMKVDETRCVACFNCIDACSESGISLKKSRFKPAVAGVSSDASKRNFLKAGLVFLGAWPLLAKARESDREDHPGFYSRGPVSPPGSLSIAHLKDRCIACQLCISACPGKVLQPAALEYGFTGMMLPMMNFETGFCNYGCTNCGEICPTGAITHLTKNDKKLTQTGRVYFNSDLCIVKTKGTACGSCSEHCPTQAVFMVPYHDFLTIPEINPEICVGCGACEYACPADEPHVAIYVIPNQVHREAKKPLSKKVDDTVSEEFPF